jgi:hypothetical protein
MVAWLIFQDFFLIPVFCSIDTHAPRADIRMVRSRLAIVHSDQSILRQHHCLAIHLNDEIQD